MEIFPYQKTWEIEAAPFSLPDTCGYRGPLLLGREAGGQIFGDGVEIGVGSLGAVIRHLVDQILPALGIQVLLGGDLRRMALGTDLDHHVTARTRRQALVIVIGQRRSGKARNKNSYSKTNTVRLAPL